MKKHRFKKVICGDAIQISTSKVYIEECCNCGLVHYMTYKVVNQSEIEKRYYLSKDGASDDIINRRKEEIHQWSADLLQKLKML